MAAVQFAQPFAEMQHVLRRAHERQCHDVGELHHFAQVGEVLVGE